MTTQSPTTTTRTTTTTTTTTTRTRTTMSRVDRDARGEKPIFLNKHLGYKQLLLLRRVFQFLWPWEKKQLKNGGDDDHEKINFSHTKLKKIMFFLLKIA